MRYGLHPEALAEYEAATAYYVARDPAVAERFVATVFVATVNDAIERILESPTRWRIIDQDMRRCLTHMFPYGVLSTVEPEFILIVAIMHCSRKPGYWKSRTAQP